MAQDIPVTPSVPWYELTVPLDEPDGSIAVVTFEFRWNFRALAWYIQTLRDESGAIMISGVKIVLGAYLGSRCRNTFFKNGVLVAIDTAAKGGPSREATLDDFGKRVILRRYTVYEVLNGRGIFPQRIAP